MNRIEESDLLEAGMRYRNLASRYIAVPWDGTWPKDITTLEIYPFGANGRWNWRLIAANGQKLARGSQAKGFHDADEAYLNAERTMHALSDGGRLVPAGMVSASKVDVAVARVHAVTDEEGSTYYMEERVLRIRRVR